MVVALLVRHVAPFAKAMSRDYYPITDLLERVMHDVA
jgi:hypothetical protein